MAAGPGQYGRGGARPVPVPIGPSADGPSRPRGVPVFISQPITRRP